MAFRNEATWTLALNHDHDAMAWFCNSTRKWSLLATTYQPYTRSTCVSACNSTRNGASSQPRLCHASFSAYESMCTLHTCRVLVHAKAYVHYTPDEKHGRLAELHRCCLLLVVRAATLLLARKSYETRGRGLPASHPQAVVWQAFNSFPQFVRVTSHAHTAGGLSKRLLI